jgi:CheY-like chemotaxis protein/signal transduction histidine kinase
LSNWDYDPTFDVMKTNPYRKSRLIVLILSSLSIATLILNIIAINKYVVSNKTKDQIQQLQKNHANWTIRLNWAYINNEKLEDLKDARNLYERNQTEIINDLRKVRDNKSSNLSLINSYQEAQKNTQNYIVNLFNHSSFYGELIKELEALIKVDSSTELKRALSIVKNDRALKQTEINPKRVKNIQEAFKEVNSLLTATNLNTPEIEERERKLAEKLQSLEKSATEVSQFNHVYKKSSATFSQNAQEIITLYSTENNSVVFILFSWNLLAFIGLALFLGLYIVKVEKNIISPLKHLIKQLDTSIENASSFISSLKLHEDDSSELNAIYKALNLIFKRMQHQSDALSFLSLDEDINSENQSYLSLTAREIRTPLNTLTNTISQLSSEYKNSDDHSLKEHIHNLHNASVQVLSLTSQIMDFNKIQDGSLRLKNVNSPLREQIITIINIYKERFNASNVSFRVLIEEDQIPEFAQLDPIRLNQILFSLLRQAWRRTSIGSITLKIESVSTSTTQQKLHFSISDTSAGYKDDELGLLEHTDIEHILASDPALVDLYLAKKLLNYFESKLFIESEDKLGTHIEFTMSFNLIDKVLHNRQNILHQFIDQIAPANYRILIIDDNKVNLKLAAKILAQAHFIANEANNALEALDYIKKDMPFDLILLDLEMPGMDGIQFARYVRESSYIQAKTIPILALTASTDEKTREEAFINGMNDFITKPFIASDLINIINKNIDLAKRFRHLN